jgi:NAD(P)-dependent dehydrogenase (short-subunit alcohol dehydrogenase family)
MRRLEGKVAIVTGAGRGLGQAFARALAREGATVVVAEIVEESGYQAAREIVAQGGQASFMACDVGDRRQIEAVVARTVAQFGGVDILVNNAMGLPPQLPIETMADGDMDLTYQTGPLATMRFMQACLPHLKRGGGKVINLASGAGISGMASYGCYAAAKEGVRALTRSAAREWGPFGINVNCICPAAITEKMMQWKDEAPDQYARIVSEVPMGRLGDPMEDIAPVVVFLASDEARFITGATIMVDGGYTMLA